MTSVSFIRRSDNGTARSGGGGGGSGCVGGSIVRIAFSPRRRNYRAMSAASQHSCSGVTIVSSSASHRESEPGCCGRCCARLPVLFERSAGTWWDPKFDSEVVEGQLRLSSLPQVRRRLRCALLYAALAAATWGAFFTARTLDDEGSPWVGTSLTLLSVGALAFVFPFNGWFIYEHRPRLGALAAALLLCTVSLLSFLDVSQARHSSPPLASFCVCVQVLIILYTAIPLPLYACSLTAMAYSLVFELLSAAFQYSPEEGGGLVGLRVLAHIATHLIGLHIFIMTQVRARSTFLKVGQSALVRRELEMEKRLKEKMINSVMPPSVAHWLLTEGPADEEEIELPDGTVRKLSSPRGSSTPAATMTTTGGGAPSNELRSLFRPFNMNRMENVSILFADIVGFTRMSSDKSAEQLVGLLNDLFGRFDQLCERLGCEKISTLGDCYYCVSGCPEPRPDHARCCVRMGLEMIRSVRQFDEDTGEKVNMRVGVHTGTVLCGVVGTKRFKFDVWSHDVTLANHMESTGKPGRVHVSQTAYDFLNDEYYFEEGELYKGMKTYFIIGNKNDVDGITSPQDDTTWANKTPSIQTDNSQQLEETGGETENPVIIVEEQDPLSPTNEPGMPKKSSLTQSWSTLNSRKDSGIRSRRSSIQAQLMESNGMSPSDFLIGSHSKDYYKSISQLSVIEASEMPLQISLPPDVFSDLGMPLNESLAQFHLLRKQSDIQMIKCIQQDSTHVDYFMRPPINKFSLFFTDPQIEAHYRVRAHCQEDVEDAVTLASSTFSTYFDIFVAAVVYVIAAFSCFILFSISLAWLTFFCLATCCQLLVLILCIRQMLSSHLDSECLKRLYMFCTQWYPWHICGAALISLPIISVCTNFSCELFIDQTKSIYFCYLIFISLMHFCNFTQLNCWMKSLLASVGAIILIALLCSSVCSSQPYQENSLVLESLNQTLVNATEDGVAQEEASAAIFSTKSSLRSEAILAILLLLLLVWYLNREFEIGYRISFHGSLLADRDQQKVQMLKDQADWLLHNIIPKHVAEHLKTTSKYSENHDDVGILFASIVNFNELYDESYHGGKECLRVLNEVIGDFDELLHRPEFCNVEKIKTIGSTFMAACGLNPKLRQECAHPYQHLFELMDFAVALQKVIEAFNADLLGFNFIIRIGYNFGDVTAGVIGSTKLYYDIWSDAVNIASRMDSTGVPGKIQVPEHCLPILEEYFEFEPRGSIYVKGKDNMNVYLLVRKKKAYEFRTPRRSDGGMSQHSVQFSH